MKWEYASFTTTSVAVVTGEKSNWSNVSEFFACAVLVARWNHLPATEPTEVAVVGASPKKSYEPDVNNAPPWDVDHDLWSVIGEQGWEVVGSNVNQTALMPGAKLGDWVTTVSCPTVTSWYFKRPKPT
jgi:hypothetical protein